MRYRPIMNPIDVPDARRHPAQPQMLPQGGGAGRDKVAQAMMSQPQFAFAMGRNFSDMYASPPQQPAQQPQMGRILRPAKGMR